MPAPLFALAPGSILPIVGLLILTGLDRVVQTYLVRVSPEWLTVLTTSV